MTGRSCEARLPNPLRPEWSCLKLRALMAPGIAAYYSYLRRKSAGERRFWCPVLDVAVILSFMYADKEIKAPRGGIKHVRAGSCTSIKADKCFVQLTGSQIATLRAGIAVWREAGEETLAPGWERDPGGRGQGESGFQPPISFSTSQSLI